MRQIRGWWSKLKDRVARLARGPIGWGCVVLLLSGCASIEFYGQAVAGQLRLITGRDSVARMLARDDLEPELRDRLELSQRILAYAETELSLDAQGSYRSYAQVPIGFGHKPGIVVVDYQVGFTDPQYALGGAPLVRRGLW